MTRTYKQGVSYKTLSMLKWDRYPVRVCRSLHHCEVCGKDITAGERYRDGGYGRRGHETCVELKGRVS